jgi:hypothetical protein
MLHLRGCMCGSNEQCRRVMYVGMQPSSKLLTFWKNSLPLASGSHFHPEDRCS